MCKGSYRGNMCMTLNGTGYVFVPKSASELLWGFQGGMGILSGI